MVVTSWDVTLAIIPKDVLVALAIGLGVASSSSTSCDMGGADNTTKDTSESMAQPIKRTTFVYGKRKNAEPEQVQRDTAAHSSTAEPAAEWLSASSHTQDSAVGRTVPSTTKRAPQCLPNASSDEESDDPGATSHFQFHFRRQMKEIDEGFDNHDEPLPQIPRSKSFPASPEAAEVPLSPQMDVRSVMDAPDTTSLPHEKALTSEDPSSGSLSPLRPSPPNATTSSLDNSPITSRLVKGRAKHPAVSDSESDPPSNSSSVSPVRHSLDTPHLRSPPTPPTSEIEMPTTKKSSKAKGKAPVRSVPPLRFNSEGLSTSLFSGSESKGKRRESSGHRVKTKAPTKKACREAAIESSRIAASRPVEVPRTDQAKYTKASFFARVQHANPGTRIPNTTLPAELPSDPIEKFSSPSSNPLNNGGLFGRPTRLLADSVPGTGSHADGQGLANPAESSDEDMPPIGHIIRQEQDKPKVEELRQSLQAKKLALLKSRTGSSNATEEDDDLEIVKDDMHSVAREAVAKRRADKSQRSPVKMKVLAMAMERKGISKVCGSGLKRTSLPIFSEQQLKHLAKPVFARDSKADKEGLRKQELDRMMMRQHEQEKLRLIKQREEEWIQKGGRVLREGESNITQASLSQAVETYAHRALNAAEEAEAMDNGVGDDESDGDYIPSIRGSPSAELAVKAEGDTNSDREEHSMTVSDQSAQLTDDEENVAPLRRQSGLRKSTRMVLGSDDEDNVRPAQSGTSTSEVVGQDTPQNRGFASSTGSQTEDENDKENNTKLMFDRSEDKENKAVVRHSPVSTRPVLGLRVGPLFSLEGGVQRSPSVTSPANYDHMVASQKEEIIRTPLKELPREDDDPFLQPASASRNSFTECLLRSGPSTPPRTISSPKGGLGSPASLRSERFRRHSLISSEGGNDENDPPGFKPQPLLLSLVETSVKRSPEACLMPFNAANRGLSQLFSDDDAGPRKVPSPSRNELSLTLDVGLQPALEVSSTLRRKADMIFEKEQEYVVAAAQKEQKPKEVLYVNDHGFLTQTRPEGESPQVYHMTPSQISRYIGTQQVDATQRTAERVPLGTLSFTATPDSPGRQPLRRLRRRSASPLPPTANPTSPEPASIMAYPPKVNTLDVLGNASKRPKVPKEKLKDSEFVAAEAEESDEDDMFGFGGPKKDDEEEDGEDEAKMVEGLVDDTVMDVEMERPDLVQEKFREHEAEDDQRREKFHQEVVEGKYRKKRLGRGLNLDEDSDDEDDEADRRIRQRVNKKRKIDGDNLEALGQSEETRAFYNTYHHDLVDDGDDEFKHLRDAPTNESDDDDEPEPESISVSEVLERVREAARNPSAVKPLDPTNTDWIDEPTADDPVGVRVKVMSRPTRTSRRPNHGNVDFDVEAPKRSIENDSEQKQWLSWAKDQGGRHHGTGRSATGAAVTGHAKVKSGGGSLRSRVTNGADNEPKAGTSRLSKAPSMLSAVSDRSSRFG